MIECVHCHQIGIMSFDGRSHWEVCPSHPARKRIAEIEDENTKLRAECDMNEYKIRNMALIISGSRDQNAKLRALVERVADLHDNADAAGCSLWDVVSDCLEAVGRKPNFDDDSKE